MSASGTGLLAGVVLLGGCTPMEGFQVVMLAIFVPLFLLAAASGSRR